GFFLRLALRLVARALLGLGLGLALGLFLRLGFFLFLLAKAVEVGEQRIGKVILLRRGLCGRFRRGLGGCLRRGGGRLRGLFLRLGLEPFLLAFLARTAALGFVGGLAGGFLFLALLFLRLALRLFLTLA